MQSNDDSIIVQLPQDFDQLIQDATSYFWGRRDFQASTQGGAGTKDRGARAAVTGGKQMDGFTETLKQILVDNGVPKRAIFSNTKIELPGYFRPTKRWDLLVVHAGNLLAVVELKSQVGPSFGNNFNNRTEEAVGSATDIWTAYREGAFGTINRPWLGYLFMLERSKKSLKPVSVREPHYPVFPDFKDASYSARYQEMCKRLVLERLYSAAAFLTSEKGDMKGTTVMEPAPELSIRSFCRSLTGSVRLAITNN